MSELDTREKLGAGFELEEYEKYVKVFDHKTWVDEYRQKRRLKK
jgi:hypothetical protein